MKAYIATIVAAALLPLSVHAQGTVNFSSAGAAQIVKDDVTGAAVGAGYTAALYWGVTGATAAQLVQIGASWPVTAGNGFIINGGTRTTGAATVAGTPGAFQVRAWSGTAATYEAAVAAKVAGTKGGVSSLFANATGDPNAQPPGTPSALSGWTTAITVTSLASVPEPSTIALATLGIGALLLIRRRK